MAGGFVITINKRDARKIIKGFSSISFALQKKYMGYAVKATAKAKAPALKAASPRNRGKLASSVGLDVTKSKKGGRRKAKLAWAAARLGYRIGKTASGRSRGGNHSYFIEEGTAARYPTTTKVFAIPWARNRKYRYLSGLRRRGNPFVNLPYTKPVKGTKFFSKWLRKNQRSMSRILTRELKANLKLAIKEAKSKTA